MILDHLIEEGDKDTGLPSDKDYRLIY